MGSAKTTRTAAAATHIIRMLTARKGTLACSLAETWAILRLASEGLRKTSMMVNPMPR